MTDQADIQARLQALRDDYARQLPEKLVATKTAWQALNTDAWHWDDAHTLHRHIHNLAGSAPTFGFTNVGQHARLAEQTLKNWLADEHVPDQQQRENFQQQLSTLLSAKLVNKELPKATLPDRRTSNKVDDKVIYLLESNPDLAAKLKLQLAHFDYHLSSFSDCNSLTQAILKQRPTAVILDIEIANGHLADDSQPRGLKACYDDELPLVFISEKNDFKSRLAAVRASGDAYFNKPVDIAQLIDRLDQLTQSHIEAPYRILLVDDDATLAAHHSLVLEQAGMQITTVTKPEEIISTMAEVRPELVLMDVYMPLCSGLELAKLIRQQDTYLSTPIVFLSTETNLEKQFSALRLGGDDFLTKPIDDDHLVASVSIRAERARSLNTLMMQDSLTGLLKHTKIKEQLAVELSRASRSGAALTFAMIDIDHFKAVNDNYGHLAGDQVIKSLARLLRQRLRLSDSIGRYGGEEFAVVLPGCDLAAAEHVLNQIREGFADLNFIHDNREFSVTLSAGIASASQFSIAEEINHAADEALYDAKNTGRNRVILSSAKQTAQKPAKD